jgi:hypothetical protein
MRCALRKTAHNANLADTHKVSFGAVQGVCLVLMHLRLLLLLLLLLLCGWWWWWWQRDDLTH